MAELRVTVRFNGELVEDQSLPVRTALKIGDAPGAAVSFPGASVTVCRVGGHLDVRGRRLAPGERTTLSLGSVEVGLEHVERIALRRLGGPPMDLRFLMVALGVTVASAWVELGADLLTRPGSPLAEVVTASSPARSPRERVAAVRPGEDEAPVAASASSSEGRVAQPDDRRTGTGYYRWYRQAVPADLEAEIARYRLDGQLGAPALHALVARGAYEADSFQEALKHYVHLTRVEPGHVAWWSGRASAEKRLGLHSAELVSLGEVLRLEPENLHARGSRAVALARFGDYSGAEAELAHLDGLADKHPYLHVFRALYESVRGREGRAIEALERAVAARAQLPQALQIELRRDIALDPAFGPLRADVQLRALLYRHFGAAAPRPLR